MAAVQSGTLEGVLAVVPGLPSLIGNSALARAAQTDVLPRQGAGPLDRGIATAINDRRGGGATLPTTARRDMEQLFGADLSHVRVHTDERADALTHAVEARAFTVGHDVFFSAGTFDAGSNAGRRLLAHELSHVVQNGPGGSNAMPDRVSGPDDAAELTADRIADAAVSGAGPVGGDYGETRIAGTAVAAVHRDLLGDAASAISGGVDALKARALQVVADEARSTPGYDLLGLALGQDPITERPILRTATRIVNALLEFIPGSDHLRQSLQESGAIERAGAWFDEQIPLLGLSWDAIRALFERAWNSFTAVDLLNPLGLWDRLSRIFAEPVQRLVTFAQRAGTALTQFVFEAVMTSTGGAGVMAVIHRAGDVISSIVHDPIGFLANLVRAVRAGLGRFGANIVTHLQTGLFGWLTGALRGAVTLPQRFDLAGIFEFVTNLLGLTWEWLRGRLVSVLGERVVHTVETTVDWVRRIVTGGIGAVVDRLSDMVGSLIETVIGSIRDWVAQSVVGAALTKLVTMFNPVGALIQAIVGIYNTIQFFIERAQQLAEFTGSVFDSIGQIASGAIDNAANAVEQALARSIPVVLGFLSRLIGLGDIAAPVRNVVDRARAFVDRAMDRVIEWVVAAARRLVGGRGDAHDDPRGEARGEAVIEPQSEAIELPGGERHTVSLLAGETFHVVMASENESEVDQKATEIATSDTATKIRKAYLDARNVVAETSPERVRAVAFTQFKALTRTLKQLILRPGPGGGRTPLTLGQIARHRKNSEGTRDDPDPLLHMTSEHAMPRWKISDYFVALGLPEIGDKSAGYMRMHTIRIYKTAGDRKTVGSRGDNVIMDRLRKMIAAGTVEGASGAGRERQARLDARPRVGLQGVVTATEEDRYPPPSEKHPHPEGFGARALAGFIAQMQGEWRTAVSDTVKAIADDHQEHGSARQEPSPVPTREAVEQAVLLQREDVELLFREERAANPAATDEE
jgi:hypothetical protein